MELKVGDRMNSVQVKLLQAPLVLKDSEQIVFPFKKAEALFYYLVVNKQASRDELVDLLWGEIDEETARKNLRHAIYMIRKAFDAEIIISPQKSTVLLNPDIEIKTDLQNFLHEKESSIEAYGGEFLKGFLVKDGDKYEEWMFQRRDYYRDMYIASLYEKLSQCSREREHSKLEHYSKLLINEDPLDERPYRLLMESYGSIGAYHKAEELYRKLKHTLGQELGIAPDNNTEKLHKDNLARRSQEDNKRENVRGFFFGRSRELDIIREQFESFSLQKENKSILIVGEAGIGKTRLKEYFFENVDEGSLYVIKSNCYQAEQDYPLKPWDQVFSTLAEIIKEENIEIPQLWKNIIVQLFPAFDPELQAAADTLIERTDKMKYKVVEEAVLEVLKKVSRKKKLAITFEDLHWMDSTSIRLLSFVLRRLGGSGVIVVATCRNSYEKRIEQFIAAMVKDGLLEKLLLSRFTRDEVDGFIMELLPQHLISQQIKERIYEETEGNAFFLIELLNTVKEKGVIGEISGKTQDILKSRIIDISEEGMKLLNITSMFFDRVDLDMLQTLSGRGESELLDTLEELQGRYIIREVEKGEDISFEFTHNKLREFIYGLQSTSRRRILHNRIGQAFEKRLTGGFEDRLLYPKLIYHFSNGGNKLAGLNYRIKNLDIYSDFSHELFPVQYDDVEAGGQSFINQGESIKYLEDLEEQLKEIKGQEKNNQEILKLELALFYAKGSYCIQEGEYGLGVKAIKDMLELACESGDFLYVLKGCRRMVYYGIQIYNTHLMQEYLTKGIELADRHNQMKEMGILLRLNGLQRLMTENYVEAEETLKHSIGVFEALNKQEDRYSLNIAAAYNYIGEIRRYNMKFSEALKYYDKAMDICDEKKIYRGIAVFSANAGKAAFDMGDYQRAKSYFIKAIKDYNQMDTLLGRSTAEGYMALLLIRETRYEEALEYMKRSETYAEKLKSPYELGLVCRVKAEIKMQVDRNSRLKGVFEAHLPLKVSEYCIQGIIHLSGVRNCYERGILEVLAKNKG
jgi:DNA-binding SARP family transcriptional activator/tetratricopeptide (TPR) repeat protein